MPLFEPVTQEQAGQADVPMTSAPWEQAGQADIPTTSTPRSLPRNDWGEYFSFDEFPLSTSGESPDQIIQSPLPIDKHPDMSVPTANGNYGYNINHPAPLLTNNDMEDVPRHQSGSWIDLRSPIPHARLQTHQPHYLHQSHAIENTSFLAYNPPTTENFQQPLDLQPQRIQIETGHSQSLQNPQQGNHNLPYDVGAIEGQHQIPGEQKVFTQMGRVNMAQEAAGPSLPDTPDFVLDYQNAPANETISQVREQGKRRRKYPSSREVISDERNTQAIIQSETKRPRQALSLKQKLEVIKYCEENNTLSLQDVSNHFGMARTTIYGIKQNSALLKEFSKRGPCASLTLKTSRMVVPRFRVLEELLKLWITDMEVRCIPVSGNKITTQAFDIHRMLSGLAAEPLPPCTFSSGWLKSFKTKQGICLKAAKYPTKHAITHAYVNLHKQLEGFDENRIYTCDVANMFVSGIRTDIFQGGKQENYSGDIDAASVSVMLSSNASGSDKRRPMIHVRGGPDLFEAKVLDDFKLDLGEKELRALVSKKWLTEFDSSFDTPYHVALLVDEEVWHSFMGTWDPCSLKRTKVIMVPKELAALMPMSNGLIKQLKVNYHILSSEKRRVSAGPAADVAFDDYLRLIREAWTQVPVSAIVRSFKRFLPPCLEAPTTNEMKSVHLGTIDSWPSKEDWRVVLNEPKVPDFILNYYLNQDKDVGPSSFLREKIVEMQSRPGFEQHFGVTGLGGVDDASKKLKAKFYMPMDYSLYVCPCSRSRAERTIVSGVLPV